MRDQAEKQRCYKKIWKRVKGVYDEGFCVSEHNLQAVLYAEFRKELSSDSHVVVEPTWERADGNAFPDLVIVEGGKITDIFELKFVPHYDAEWKKDIKKLFSYITKHNERPPQYLVRLDPKTGQWKDPLPVQEGCCLHFVAVAQRDSKNSTAVWPEKLKNKVREEGTDNEKWNHWFGRTGTDDGEWGIEFAWSATKQAADCGAALKLRGTKPR